ncbi:MAG TPA: hypothetical protein VKY89_14285 [Thermoanaerobaculia bacterium]|nr:hypothetical protein [Thermoanaerobaculia bacterium]
MEARRTGAASQQVREPGESREPGEPGYRVIGEAIAHEDEALMAGELARDRLFLLRGERAVAG